MPGTLLADGADYRWSAQAMAARKAAIAQYDGIFAETFDRLAIVSVAALLDGSVYYTRIGLTKGDLITNIRCDIGTAGVGTSIGKMGIVDRNFNFLRMTADQSAAFNTVGEKIAPLTAPLLIGYDDHYYAAWFAKTATTMPGPCRGGGFQGGGVSRAVLTAQTDIPATANPTLGGNNATAVWLGVS